MQNDEKNAYVKNNVMTTAIKHCRGERYRERYKREA